MATSRNGGIERRPLQSVTHLDCPAVESGGDHALCGRRMPFSSVFACLVKRHGERNNDLIRSSSFGQANEGEIMSGIARSRGLLRASVVVFTAIWLAPIEVPLFSLLPCPARPAAAQDFPPEQVPGQDMPIQDPDDMPRPRGKAVRKRVRLPEKGAAKKADAKAKTKKDATTETKAADAGGLKFSQDIAPILVANCVGCHSGDRPGMPPRQAGPDDLREPREGDAQAQDLRRRQAGREPPGAEGQRRGGAADAPGGPEQACRTRRSPRSPSGSRRGRSSTPGSTPRRLWPPTRHPPSSCGRKSCQAAGRGTRQEDRGRRPGAMEAGQSQAQARDRARQAVHRVQQPAQRSGDQHRQGHGDAVRAPEEVLRHRRRRTGSKRSACMFSAPERLHRVRPNGGDPRRSTPRSRPAPSFRSPNLTSRPSTRPGARRKSRRPKRTGRNEAKRSEESGGPDRSLNGVLTEALGTGVVAAAAGTSPRWLGDGNRHLSWPRTVEPRSPYYQQLRQTAFANFDQGWRTRASEALGGADQITIADCTLRRLCLGGSR